MGISAGVLARLTRAKTLPILLAPLGVGAALAADRTGAFHTGRFVLTLAGASALHLGAMALNDFYDERSGADGLGRLERSSVITGSGFIASQTMTPRAVLAVAVAAWTLAAGIGVALAILTTPLVLALGAAGALLAHQYVAPPARYGYRGAGPAGTFLAYGVLPVAGAYAVQAGRIDAIAWWASIVPGLLGALVYFNADLLHWRGDRTAKKRTIAARVEAEAALAISGMATIAAYVVLTVQVALDVFPAWTLLALVTAPPIASAWGRAAQDPIAQRMLALLGTTLGTAVVVNLALAIPLGLRA